MLDPANPAKYLLFAWLLAASVMAGVRLARRFIGAAEPLDTAGYAVAFAMLLVGVVGSWVARMVRHFPTTFLILATLLSLPLVIARVRRARRAATSPPPQISSLRAAPGLLTVRERLTAGVLGVLALIPALQVIWRTQLWDDWYVYLPLTSAFSRGIFPVVYPFLPDRAVTYHFGFAWIAGLVEYHTGISPEHCVDIVSSICLVAYYLSAAGTLRIWVGGRLAPYLGAAAVLNFGPFAWLWTIFTTKVGPGASWFDAWLGNASETSFTDGVSRNIDYILQKPMLSGMALVWLVMALLFISRRRHSVAGAAVAGASAGMLELFQYPVASLAAVAGSAVLFLDVLRPQAERRTQILMLVAFALLAFALPHLNGGFVANPQGDPIFVDRVWTFPYPAFVSYARAHELPTFLCYLLYYGAAAFVLPFVVPKLWRQRSLNTLWVALFVLGGFAIPHVMHHRSSPSNITKFFHLSAFAMAMLATGGVLLATRGLSYRVRAPLLGGFLLAVSLSTCASSLSIGLANTWSRGNVDPARVSSLRTLARWLRAHAGTHDRAFTLTDEVEAMSGVLSPLPPEAPGGRQLYTVDAHGYAPAYVAMVKGLTDSAAASMDEQSLSRLKVRWVVLPDPLPPSIGPEARRRLAQPAAFQLREHIKLDPNSWLIYEYLRGPPPGSLDD